MKILAVADREEPILYNYFDKERFKGIDLILSCGDLKPEYLSFLVTMINIPLFYVRGNHDLIYKNNPPQGCEDIDGKIMLFKGQRILGLEGSIWYNGKDLQYTERQMEWKILKLRPRIWWSGGIDIVITHAPPRHIHDAEDKCHQGFEAFRYLIDRYQPCYFLHGHNHLCYQSKCSRISLVGETKVVNCDGYYILEI